MLASPGSYAFGVYAEQYLEPHALLKGKSMLMYKGEVKTTAEFEKEVANDPGHEADHHYALDFKCIPSLTVDATHQRNVAALINDFRNRKGKRKRQKILPNVRFVECYFNGMPVMLIDNTRRIAKDEQLLLDYGEDFWKVAKAAAAQKAAEVKCEPGS